VEDGCRLGLDIVDGRFGGNEDEVLLGTSERETTAVGLIHHNCSSKPCATNNF